jgi:hypothetical protein
MPVPLKKKKRAEIPEGPLRTDLPIHPGLSTNSGIL